MALEVLHGALVFLGGGARREGAEIPSPPRFGIRLARIQPVLAGSELADHDASGARTPSRRSHRMPASSVGRLRRAERETVQRFPAAAGILDEHHFAATCLH